VPHAIDAEMPASQVTTVLGLGLGNHSCPSGYLGRLEMWALLNGLLPRVERLPTETHLPNVLHGVARCVQR
jgi:hypothetical protein